MERRFACTACGKCCHGVVPLTIDDALAHAGRFPLAVAWTTVRQGGRSFDVTAELGITIKLKNRKHAAIRIAPVAHLPPTFPCPELGDDGLCRIHDTKPLRCRTMPVSGYRDETDQDDLLVPRSGWRCETGANAVPVYRDKHLIERTAFDLERAQLRADSATLKPYAEWLIDSAPALAMDLRKAALRPAGGQVLVSFATLVPRLPKVDIHDLADRQLPVMRAFAARTVDSPALAAFHRDYATAAAEWEKVAASRS